MPTHQQWYLCVARCNNNGASEKWSVGGKRLHASADRLRALCLQSGDLSSNMCAKCHLQFIGQRRRELAWRLFRVKLCPHKRHLRRSTFDSRVAHYCHVSLNFEMYMLWVPGVIVTYFYYQTATCHYQRCTGLQVHYISDRLVTFLSASCTKCFIVLQAI